MHITMVKKRLASGEPCAKCIQAEERIRDRGAWDAINEVVIADETDAESAGMKLGKAHGIEVAPFFIVRDDDGQETVYTSVLKFLKEYFPKKAATPTAAAPRELDVDALAAEYKNQHPEQIVKWALGTFGADLGISFSGAEDVVLVHMAAQSELPFTVFSLDTGRLHPETLEFIDRVRNHYSIDIQVMAPDSAALEAFVKRKGLFSFYEDGHQECCGVRKVEPLRRALSGFRAWATGQRKDQSPATRSDVNVIEWDQAFKGREGDLLKINPLANWTSAQVWAYIREQRVPYNALHDRGFVSIGCAPCTRELRPGEHERAARWWWEDTTKRECGLHVAK